MQFENIDGNFREIPGYEGYYVTQNGVIVSTRKGAPKVVKTQVNDEGYHVLITSIDGFRTSLRRARAIALAWIPNDDPINKIHACHNDGSKDNDTVSNIRWGTFVENMADKRIHGTGYTGGPVKKLDDAKATAIRMAHSAGRAIRALALEYNVDRQTIRRCVNYVTYQEAA
jgi:hypothetical protein